MLSLLALALAGSTDVCNAWNTEGARVTLDEVPVVESSGLAVGRLDDTVLYTIEDTGADALIQLMTADGTYLGSQLVRGATNTDWEDLAAGPCPPSMSADSCLYIGDIGDNDEERDDVTVWVVAESTLGAETASACALRYPDGAPHDAEALFVDPDGRLRIVSKSNNGTPSVFLLDAPKCDGSEEILAEEAELSLSGGSEEDREVTGAAMSEDGTLVVLRSSTQAWVWRGCTLDWSSPTEVLDLASEPQGEAITLLSDGGMLTTSEGDPLRLRSVPCTSREELKCTGCGCHHAAPLPALLLLPILVPIVRRARRRPPGARAL